jgi:hypothetical protein
VNIARVYVRKALDGIAWEKTLDVPAAVVGALRTIEATEPGELLEFAVVELEAGPA